MTNFDMSRYDVKSILESSTLPIGGAAKRLKDVEQAEMALDVQRENDHDNMTAHLSDGINNYGATATHHGWPTIAFQQAHQAPFSMHYPPYAGQRVWCKQEQDSDHAATAHTFQHDLHQLQLGGISTHNFFQPSSVMHNLMAMESASSMEHSSGSNSNSVIYSNGGGANCSDGVGYGGNNGGGYMIPLSTVIASDHSNNQIHQGSGGFGDNKNEVKAALGYDQNMYGSADPYHSSRNLYYLSQQSSSSGGEKGGSTYDQASACNNWVPTAVPTFAQRSGNMASVCHAWSPKFHSLE